jgi:hypothetical protein
MEKAATINMRSIIIATALLLMLFAVQGAIHGVYIHVIKFNPATAKCDALHGDVSASSMEPRQKCINEMFEAMAESNDLLWFLDTH